jgi:hypothetical protein
LFYTLPQVERAIFRVYRLPVREPPELVIVGSIAREDRVPMNVRSLA